MTKIELTRAAALVRGGAATCLANCAARDKAVARIPGGAGLQQSSSSPGRLRCQLTAGQPGELRRGPARPPGRVGDAWGEDGGRRRERRGEERRGEKREEG